MDGYELKQLAGFDEKTISSIADNFRAHIKSDEDSELFAGESCSRIVSAKEEDMSSVFLMSFSQGYDQQKHFHTGSRILLIFSRKDASVTLGRQQNSLKEEKMLDNSCYLLRMETGLVHKFSGDFVAFSIHPKDTIVSSHMEDETTFV